MSTETIETGGPAFPLPELRDQFGNGLMEGCPGMTLRDWFAGQAIAGQLASFSTEYAVKGTAAFFERNDLGSVEGVTKIAYAVADAALVERAKAARS